MLAIEYTKSPPNIDFLALWFKTVGPGPIKSDRGHAHRFSPHYHHARRVGPQSRHFIRLDSENGVERHSHHSAERPYDSSSEPLDDGPRYSSIDYQHPRGQSLSSPTQATPPHQDSHSSPLLRVLYPNLTLTLALIYVDRLKAVSIFFHAFFLSLRIVYCGL